MNQRIEQFLNGGISKEELKDILQGWEAYAQQANTYRLRKRVRGRISLSGNN